MTDVILRGGGFEDCPAAADARLARAAARKKGRRGEVRKLFASDDDGQYRTHGANSVATVRGTDVDPGLWPAADLSVQAQLDYLRAER